MAGGAETPNIAALPAIARLGACESAPGPDADRHVKLLIQFAVEGSLSGACSQAALAPTFTMLPLASLAIGITAVTAQIIILTVSGLAKPADRGRVVGTLLSGLSAGLLLARTLSGFVGAHAGWKSMFVLAGFIDLALMAIIWFGMPEARSNSKLSYPGLLASLGVLLRDEPSLRAACMTGFFMFAVKRLGSWTPFGVQL